MPPPAAGDSRPARQTARVTVAVIDIGSNTARLLVARRGRGGAIVPVRSERTVLGLGHEIELSGVISPGSLDLTIACARRYAALARSHGASRVDLVVTAPGRQGENADVLLAGLTRATGLPARVLSAHDEGRYAFEGATAGNPGLAVPVAVCDVGGGSTEIAIGRPEQRPDGLISLDIGSLRLTSRFLAEDPPGRRAIEAAGCEVRDHLADLADIRVTTALATGGSARALRKMVGRTLDARRLD